ncbi:MAG: DUF3833 domain-containing protein [Lentisphaeria bacterium]|nr:DUF3833 domain-containing protein [Lentisphaeria bacterium]
MKWMLTLLTIFSISCTSNKGPGSTGPDLNPTEFFAGNLFASGYLKNRSGEVIRTFNADIVGIIKGDDFILKEDFTFNDGEKQFREWTFSKQKDGSYSAEANDVTGKGKAIIYDNYMDLDYVLRINHKGDEIDIPIKDKIVLTAPNILIAESKMTKYGLDVGTIHLVMIKK